MNFFEEKLVANRQSLRRGHLQTLQINVGRKCNQTCHHCHVEAAPWRTEMMNGVTARRVGDWIQAHRPEVVDITGGAPELSEHFCYLVETARACGCHVIDRSNLTIIETEAYAWLPEFLATHEVEVVASLPCYLEENVNAQRGDGVFEKSIHALKKLNAVGYGSRLPLNLV
jgi:radical SAM/Cys-rich protein